MPDDPPRDLTSAEQDCQARAQQLLERTAYDAENDAPGRVTDARACARGALEALAALEAERSARRALQARCEAQQALLGARAYAACAEAGGA